jgi:hypothetical protein
MQGMMAERQRQGTMVSANLHGEGFQVTVLLQQNQGHEIPELNDRCR